MAARLILVVVGLVVTTPALSGLNPSGCDDLSSIQPFTQFRYGQIQSFFDVLVVVDPKQPLVPQCTRCHNGQVGAGFLSLSEELSFNNLVGLPSAFGSVPWLRVSPGIPDQSWLFYKINCLDPGFGSPMPSDTPRLSTTQQRFIFDWIRVGAPLSKNGFEDR